MLTEAKQRVLLGGVPVRLVSPSLSGDSVSAGRCSGQDPDASWRRQSTQTHAHREAMLVLQGEVTQSLNGGLYRGGPGTLFLYDAGDRHDNGFPSTAPDSDQMWMFFAPDFITCCGVEVRDGRYGNDFRHTCKSPELIMRLNSAWDDTAGLSEPLRRALGLAQMRALFTVLFTDVVAAALRGKDRFSVQEEAVLEVRQFLERTAGRGADVTTLARMAGFSRPHFMRLFRHHTGMTVHACIDQVRMRRYEQLFEQGASMKVIADELGLKSSSALAHWRRRKIGGQAKAK